MSKKKMLFTIVGAIGAVGAVFGIKKLIEKSLDKAETLYSEDDIFDGECGSNCEECCCANPDYTENIATKEDIEGMDIPDEILESINSEIFEEDVMIDTEK